MKRLLYLFASSVIFITACTTNAVTGRKQLSLIPESALQAEAVTQYRTFLSQNRVVNSAADRNAEMVKRVGTRIAAAITEFYRGKGLGKELEGYNWEFNLIDNKDI